VVHTILDHEQKKNRNRNRTETNVKMILAWDKHTVNKTKSQRTAKKFTNLKKKWQQRDEAAKKKTQKKTTAAMSINQLTVDLCCC